MGYVDALTKRGFQCILIDARGHGDSDKPHTSDAYSRERGASDVVSVLDRLKLDKAHFWGYSMGGGIGWAMLRFHPERLISAVLGGSQPPSGKGAVRTEWIEKLREGGAGAMWTLWDSEPIPQVRERLLSLDVDAFLARLKEVPENAPYEDPGKWVKTPCLTYAGDRDKWNCERIKEAAPRIMALQFVEVPGLTHAECLFASDRVLPIVLPFLQFHKVQKSR